MLVVGVDDQTIIDIDIRCGVCNNVYSFSNLPDETPVPLYLIRLYPGVYAMGTEGIALPSGACIVSFNAAESKNFVHTPRPSDGVAFPRNFDDLSALIQRVDLLTAHNFSRQVGSVRRAFSAKNTSNFHECPPAWAIVRLEGIYRTGSIDLMPNSLDTLACSIVHNFIDKLDAWEHHPFFAYFPKWLCNEFMHTNALFSALLGLRQAGNHVGLLNASLNTHATPDMYVSLTTERQLSLEIKAPRILQGPTIDPSASDVTRCIETQLRTVSRQLIHSEGGLLIVSAYRISNATERKTISIAESVIKKKKYSGKLAGILLHMHRPAQIQLIDGQIFIGAGEAQFFTVKNPGYVGESDLLDDGPPPLDLESRSLYPNTTYGL
ncbi:hypothetical protein [Caballeronia sp. dw_276]|uniref:hypothetical protein n=1 Tax=Caballeronia sp. dw_276 TaxID=2719795 RepID=UPI001BD68E52|nr:hypothetical protein [Caballeronia sp. dw_276]